MGALADFDNYDGWALAELVRKREVSASELLDTVIERIESVNPKINAIVLRMYDQARAAIERGLPQGSFTGVPYLLKDLHQYYAGVPTTSGCRFFRDFIPDHDSTLTARLKASGLVICGKSASPEFGLTTTTESVLFGQTLNPWNRGYSAGGSSGGSAAAVAAGILPMAHATDGGGSIRIPAACCGVFGLKPTRGRNPHGPDLAESWAGQSAGHAVTRTVRDNAALLDVTAGPDVGDPYCAPPIEEPYANAMVKPPGRLKIALCTTSFNGAAVDTECAAAANNAARLCEKLGHDVEIARPEIDAQEQGEARYLIVLASVRLTLDTRAKALGRPYTDDDIERITMLHTKAAEKVSGADYLRAVQTIHRAGRQVGRFFEKYDILLTPTIASRVQPIGRGSLMLEPEAFVRDIEPCIAFTALFNCSGTPAMSVPLAWDSNGLPIGIQFAARFGAEATLLKLARQLEEAQPWFNRRPRPQSAA